MGIVTLSRPTSFGGVRQSTGAYVEKFKREKQDDYTILRPESSLIDVLGEIPSTPTPIDSYCAQVRSTSPEHALAYERASQGKKSSIILREGHFPGMVTLDKMQELMEFGRRVPPILDFLVHREEYEKFREFMPKLADSRRINYVDIVYSAFDKDRKISIHLNTENLVSGEGTLASARIYRKEMTPYLVRFMEDTVQRIIAKGNPIESTAHGRSNCHGQN